MSFPRTAEETLSLSGHCPCPEDRPSGLCVLAGSACCKVTLRSSSSSSTCPRHIPGLLVLHRLSSLCGPSLHSLCTEPGNLEPWLQDVGGGGGHEIAQTENRADWNCLLALLLASKSKLSSQIIWKTGKILSTWRDIFLID